MTKLTSLILVKLFIINEVLTRKATSKGYLESQTLV